MSNEIDFDFWKKETVSDGFEIQPSINTLQRSVSQEIDLVKIKDFSESLVIDNAESFNQAISMSLQVRRVKNILDNARKEIIAPYLSFQKEVNKKAKDIEKDLIEIEDVLSVKINEYSSQALNLDEKISNEDGTAKLTKKIQWTISDESLVPREYLKVDEEKINNAIDLGVKNILGICLQEIEVIEMRAKKVKK